MFGFKVDGKTEMKHKIVAIMWIPKPDDKNSEKIIAVIDRRTLAHDHFVYVIFNYIIHDTGSFLFKSDA